VMQVENRKADERLRVEATAVAADVLDELVDSAVDGVEIPRERARVRAEAEVTAAGLLEEMLDTSLVLAAQRAAARIEAQARARSVELMVRHVVDQMVCDAMEHAQTVRDQRSNSGVEHVVVRRCSRARAYLRPSSAW
jgi:hypothetical protein